VEVADKRGGGLVTSPERALEHARAAAAAMRADGAYGEVEPAGELPTAEAPTLGKLFEWALVDPDLRHVRSTRRLGAPITALKRGLLRLLAQYHAELIAEQARFNVNLVRYVRQLEERIAALEARRGSMARDEGKPVPRSE
jgi:hypothetical protein